MTDGLVGVVEGFYGRPWSWDARVEVGRWCATRGMTHYVYAPKDDAKHRERWREPYDQEELAGFERFAEEGSLRLGFGISPGLSMRYDAAADREALGAKVDQVIGAGAELIMLALDDIPFGGGEQGAAHARLTTWLRDQLDPTVAVLLCPTEYVGTDTSPYLDALATGVPADVPIGWTGRAVVNDQITVEDANGRAAALGDRPPLLWDNYPVNDGPMSDRLFMGPLRGRDAGLPGACAGYLANPMQQARASLLPLASVAAFAQGEDPAKAWHRAATDLGWLAFASACDGEDATVAARAAADGDLAPARRLFAAAASCTAPGLEEEAAAWVEQVQRDARLALQAIEVLDGDHSPEQVLAMGVRWQASRRSRLSVFGPRCSIRPSLTQAADGSWRVLPDSVRREANAIDAVVELALGSL